MWFLRFQHIVFAKIYLCYLGSKNKPILLTFSCNIVLLKEDDTFI